MALKARVRQDGPNWPVTVCGGRATFVKREWRDVPAGYEEEVAAAYFLEVVSADDIEVSRMVESKDFIDKPAVAKLVAANPVARKKAGAK